MNPTGFCTIGTCVWICIFDQVFIDRKRDREANILSGWDGRILFLPNPNKFWRIFQRRKVLSRARDDTKYTKKNSFEMFYIFLLVSRQGGICLLVYSQQGRRHSKTKVQKKMEPHHPWNSVHWTVSNALTLNPDTFNENLFLLYSFPSSCTCTLFIDIHKIKLEPAL